MAAKRGSGPGTSTRRGVCSTMDNPFGKGVSTSAPGGMDGRNKAPFDKPQAMGGGGIPTKFFDPMTATLPKTVSAGMVAPPIGGTQNVGQRRFKK